MVAIGSDHGGFELKESVIRHLKEIGMEVKDVGCYSKDSCDYPVFGHAVAKAVASGECEKGIVILRRDAMYGVRMYGIRGTICRGNGCCHVYNIAIFDTFLTFA